MYQNNNPNNKDSFLNRPRSGYYQQGNQYENPNNSFTTTPLNPNQPPFYSNPHSSTNRFESSSSGYGGEQNFSTPNISGYNSRSPPPNSSYGSRGPYFGSTPQSNPINNNSYYGGSPFYQAAVRRGNSHLPSSSFSPPYQRNNNSPSMSPFQAIWKNVTNIFSNDLFSPSYSQSPPRSYYVSPQTNMAHGMSSPHSPTFNQSPQNVNRSHYSSPSRNDPLEKKVSPFTSPISPNRRKLDKYQNKNLDKVENVVRFHNDWILLNALIFLCLSLLILFLINVFPQSFYRISFSSDNDLNDYFTLVIANLLAILFLTVAIIATYRYCSSPHVKLTNYQRALLGLPTSENSHSSSVHQTTPLRNYQRLPSPRGNISSPVPSIEYSTPLSQENTPISPVPYISKMGTHSTISSSLDLPSVINNEEQEILSPHSLKEVLAKGEQNEKEGPIVYSSQSYDTEPSFGWPDFTPSFKYQPSVAPQLKVRSLTGTIRKIPYEQVLLKLNIRQNLFDEWLPKMRNWIYTFLLKPVATKLIQFEKEGVDVTVPPREVAWNDRLNPRNNQSEILRIQKYLRVYGSTSIKYLIQRIKELARQEYLADFKWNSGTISWAGSPELSTDSQILIHFFCTYMDEQMVSERAFSSRYFAQTPQIPDTSSGVVIYQSSIQNPHFDLVFPTETWSIIDGRYNLFCTLILFIHFFKVNFNGYLGPIFLGSSIQLLRVIDS